MEKVSINHIAEQFLYEYYCRPEAYDFEDGKELAALLAQAEEARAADDPAGALEPLRQAQRRNPASADIRFRRIACCYRAGLLDELLAQTRAVYPFCATRAELALFYRWLGCYYLESYQPELAQALYRYSTLFCESEQAENDIRYLEEALQKKMPPCTAEELQEKLTENDIPIRASGVTLALLIRAGEEAERRAAEEASNTAAVLRRQACDCYSMVYDLTGESGLAERIRRLL